MGRLKTMKDQYLNDDSMKKFNTWANDIVSVLYHYVLALVALNVFESKFSKILVIIYAIMVTLSLFTPSEEK